MKAAARTIEMNDTNENLAKMLEEVIAEPVLSRADKAQVMFGYLVAQLQNADAQTPAGQRAEVYKKLFVYTTFLAQHLYARATSLDYEGPPADELYGRVEQLSRAVSGENWRDNLPSILPDAPPLDTGK